MLSLAHHFGVFRPLNPQHAEPSDGLRGIRVWRSRTRRSNNNTNKDRGSVRFARLGFVAVRFLRFGSVPRASCSWGKWHPRPEPSQTSGVHSGFAAKAKEELAEGSDTEDLMASAQAFCGQGR